MAQFSENESLSLERARAIYKTFGACWKTSSMSQSKSITNYTKRRTKSLYTINEEFYLFNIFGVYKSFVVCIEQKSHKVNAKWKTYTKICSKSKSPWCAFLFFICCMKRRFNARFCSCLFRLLFFVFFVLFWRNSFIHSKLKS